MVGNGLYDIYFQGDLWIARGEFSPDLQGPGYVKGHTIHNHVSNPQGRVGLAHFEDVYDRNGRDWLIDEFDRWEMLRVNTNAYSIDVGYQSDTDNGAFIATELKAPQLKFRHALEEVWLNDIDDIQHFNWQGGPGFDPLNPDSWHFVPMVTIDGTRLK
jgi:hypothetical protein